MLFIISALLLKDSRGTCNKPHTISHITYDYNYRKYFSTTLDIFIVLPTIYIKSNSYGKQKTSIQRVV